MKNYLLTAMILLNCPMLFAGVICTKEAADEVVDKKPAPSFQELAVVPAGSASSGLPKLPEDDAAQSMSKRSGGRKKSIAWEFGEELGEEEVVYPGKKTSLVIDGEKERDICEVVNRFGSMKRAGSIRPGSILRRESVASLPSSKDNGEESFRSTASSKTESSSDLREMEESVQLGANGKGKLMSGTGAEESKVFICQAITDCMKDGILELSDLAFEGDELTEILVSNEVVESVKEIYLNNCSGLSTLADLRHLSGLKHLEVANSNLRDFGGFPESVLVIDLHNNKLTTWPNLQNLPNLRQLNLSGNYLLTCPDEVQQAYLERKFFLNVESNPRLRLSDSFLKASFAEANQNLAADASVGFSSTNFDLLASLPLRQGDFPNAIPVRAINGHNEEGIIYLGGQRSMQPEILTQLKPQIHMVVNCAAGEVKLTEILAPNDIAVKEIKLMDVAEQAIDFSEGIDSIAQALADDGVVAVNCAMGCSRSASMVIAYFMQYKEMPLLETLKHVQSYRKVICPNGGFMAQLMIFEKQLFGGEITKKAVESIVKQFYAQAYCFRGEKTLDHNEAVKQLIHAIELRGVDVY